MVTTKDDDQKWRAEWEAQERRRATVFKKTAKSIAPKLTGLDATEIETALEQIWQEFQGRLAETGDIKNASDAKEQLAVLSTKAYELSQLILNLDQGAVEIMNQGNAPQELIDYAEPFNLPNHDLCFRLEIFTSVQKLNSRSNEKAAGDLWAIRLRALAKLARLKADWLGEQIASGGRKDFITRLRGLSNNEWLAQICKNFAEIHGCTTQATELKMIQAILETSQDEKIKPHAGRKAIRKVAQTQPNAASD
jgi:hypothetical protein